MFLKRICDYISLTVKVADTYFYDIVAAYLHITGNDNTCVICKKPPEFYRLCRQYYADQNIHVFYPSFAKGMDVSKFDNVFLLTPCEVRCISDVQGFVFEAKYSYEGDKDLTELTDA